MYRKDVSNFKVICLRLSRHVLQVPGMVLEATCYEGLGDTRMMTKVLKKALIEGDELSLHSTVYGAGTSYGANAGAIE